MSLHCEAGTLSHRCGGRSFAGSGSRSADPLHREDARVNNADEVLEAMKRETRVHKQRRAETADTYANHLLRCRQGVVPSEVLAGRQMLLSACEWRGLPHTCGCVHARLDAKLAVDQLLPDVKTTPFSEAWKARNAVVQVSGEVPEVPASQNRRCKDHNHCFCGRMGERQWLFYSRFRAAMKEVFSKDAVKTLQDGEVVLLFRGKPASETGPDVVESYAVVNVPYHLQRPWSLVFLSMTAPPDDDVSRNS